MADNTQLDTGSGGDILATASLSFSGDTAVVQIVGAAILSGSEGSWSLAQFVGGAGAVAAGVQRVTLANDDTLTAAANALLTTIDSDTGNIATDTSIIAGAVDTQMQCDIVGALPAGANAIGKLAANSGVDIGDVDVTSVPAPLSTTGGGTEAAALRVTIANDSTGVVSVDDGGGTLTVDSGAAFTIQEDGAALTALQLIDDTVAVLGTATYTETTTKGTVVGAVRNDDLATLANTDNEIAPVQVDANGAVYVNPAASEIKLASGVAAGGAPGTDDIIAAVAARKIRILAISLTATSTTANNVFLDNADNDLWFNTGNPLPLSLDADGDTVAGHTLGFNPGGWFETDTVNEAVTLNSSAAQDIAWTVTYIEVP